jgi:tRNA wybutosine-synthesizing protein 4
MVKKRDTVESTIELRKALTNIKVPAEGDVLLRSDQYLQLGCDLRDLSRLDKALASIFDVQTCQILLVAEVSITYMNASYSDDLIEWASKLPHGKVLLKRRIEYKLTTPQHAFAFSSNSFLKVLGIRLLRQ